MYLHFPSVRKSERNRNRALPDLEGLPHSFPRECGRAKRAEMGRLQEEPRRGKPPALNGKMAAGFRGAAPHVQPLSRLQRQLPFQGSPLRASYTFLKKRGARNAGGGFRNADFGGFNLWPPKSPIEPAGASGCRPCRPAMPTRSFPKRSGKPKNPGSLIYASRIRVLFGGSNRVQAQPAGSRWGMLSLPDRRPCGATSSSFPQTKNPEALIYGRRIRLVGASTACRLSLPASPTVPVPTASSPSGRRACGRDTS